MNGTKQNRNATVRRHMSLTRRDVLLVLGSVAASTYTPDAAIGQAAAENRKTITSRFLDAVINGQTARVVAMLDKNAELAKSKDRVGRSAYVLARVHGHSGIGQLLVERGIELGIIEAVMAADWDRVNALAAANPQIMNAAHPVGGNPLYASALVGGGQQYRLRALGSDPDGRPDGGTGQTPARAAMDGTDPIGALLAATDLLSDGADVNATQRNGDSILHGAVYSREISLVRLALRKGANVEARDSAGRNSLDVAEELGWVPGIELLRNHETVHRDYRGSRFAFDANREPFTLMPLADVSLKRQSEVTSVSHFSPERVRSFLSEDPRLIHSISTDAELAIEACGHTGQKEVIGIHLDHGAPLSLPTAISGSHLDHARWLLRNDPNLVHERGPHDFPVMWYPAIGHSVEAAALLLEFGAPIEQESGGETALHWAVLRNDVDLIHFLLDAGADPTAIGYRTNRAGLTPYQLARFEENDSAIRALRRAGVKS